MSAKYTSGPWRVQWGRGTGDYPLGVGTWDRNVVNSLGCPAQQESAANAHLISAAPDLLEALMWREQFERRSEESAVETFERVAEVFYRETGHLAPGKDCCLTSPEVRQQAWDEWMSAGRARVRAAITKATGEPT